MDLIYTVLYKQEVRDIDIPKLSLQNKQRIAKAISHKLTTRPELFGKPLRHSLKGIRSLRVGQYRILFLIRPKKKEVHILAIIHRSSIYKHASKRI